MEENLNGSADVTTTSSESTVNDSTNVQGAENTQPEVVETNETGANGDETKEKTNVKDDFTDGSKFAKAFSKRLNAEKEKLTKQYANHVKVIEMAAKNFDMTPDEYIKSILEDSTNNEDNVSTEEKSEKDLLIEELLKEKKEKELAEEWENQANLLKEIDKDISIDKISDEMFELSQNKNIPLHFIYAYEMLTKNKEEFTKQIREQAIAEFQKVNKTTGSLSSGAVVQETPSISSMNAKDFKELKERVMRGEVVDL